jgi:hypothetical protein
MSLRADIYVAHSGEALRYNAVPEQFADRAAHEGYTVLELSILWAIIRGTEWDEASLDEFECLLDKDGGERLIHRLPDELVSELSRLSPDRLAVAAPEWAGIEELRWPPEQARRVVEDLIRLARKSVESGRGVYLWNSVSSAPSVPPQKQSFWWKLFRA